MSGYELDIVVVRRFKAVLRAKRRPRRYGDVQTSWFIGGYARIVRSARYVD